MKGESVRSKRLGSPGAPESEAVTRARRVALEAAGRPKDHGCVVMPPPAAYPPQVPCRRTLAVAARAGLVVNFVEDSVGHPLPYVPRHVIGPVRALTRFITSHRAQLAGPSIGGTGS